MANQMGDKVRRSVSLNDVACAAGVSTASVSRVINDPDKVRPVLRKRIERAVDRLGYIPSGAARALKTRQTHAVGAIVPTLDDSIFATGISALQRRLAKRGYTLLVAATEYDAEQELREVQTLLTRGVEGLMLIGEAHHADLDQLLSRAGVPFVNCWIYSAASPNPCIGFDNERAARRLTEYLIDLGHCDIAMIAGITEGNDRAQGRVEGVRAALAAHCLCLRRERYIEQPYGVGAGRRGLGVLLSRSRTPPTAVICGNDVLAMGALFECQARGIRVPETLSITGFDDLSISAHLQPGLTTVHVPSAEMGEQAADFLLNRLHDKADVFKIEVETNVVVRGTTGRARL